jgi:hypothetical protein
MFSSIVLDSIDNYLYILASRYYLKTKIKFMNKYCNIVYIQLILYSISLYVQYKYAVFESKWLYTLYVVFALIYRTYIHSIIR